MKKYKKYIFLIAIMIVGSFLCFYGFTFAKYVYNSAWDYYFKSKGFYFSSDYLGSSTVKNVDNQWDGGSIHFNIMNALNQSVITDYDINYRATCTIEGDASSQANCHINGTNSNTQDGVLSIIQVCNNTTNDGIDVSSFNKETCESGGYDWINKVNTKDFYFDVIPIDNNNISDATVNVTVVSTSPYHKTISGDFTLHKGDSAGNNVNLDYKSYSDYDRLIISNPSSNTKCVNLKWNADKLLINAEADQFSSSNTDSNGYLNEIKLNIEAKSNLSYIFYRRIIDASYNVDDFSIEETSGC